MLGGTLAQWLFHKDSGVSSRRAHPARVQGGGELGARGRARGARRGALHAQPQRQQVGLALRQRAHARAVLIGMQQGVAGAAIACAPGALLGLARTAQAWRSTRAARPAAAAAPRRRRCSGAPVAPPHSPAPPGNTAVPRCQLAV